MKQSSSILLLLLLFCQVSYAQKVVLISSVKVDPANEGYILADENFFVNQDTKFDVFSLSTLKSYEVPKPARAKLKKGTNFGAVGSSVVFQGAEMYDLHIAKASTSEQLRYDAMVKKVVPGRNFTLLNYTSSDNNTTKIVSFNNLTHEYVKVLSFPFEFNSAIAFFEKDDLFYIAVPASTGINDIYVSDGTIAGTRLLGSIAQDASVTNWMSYFIKNGEGIYFANNRFSASYDSVYNYLYNLSAVDNTVADLGASTNLLPYEGQLYVWNGSRYGFNSKTKSIVKAEGDNQAALKTSQAGFVAFVGEYNSKLLFTIPSDSSWGVSSAQDSLVVLYETDGTAAGTRRISDHVRSAYFTGEGFANYNGYLYFSRTGGEIIRYDGVKYSLVEDVCSGRDELLNLKFHTYNNSLYFTANPSADPTRLNLYKLTDNASTIQLKSYADYNGNQKRDYTGEPELPNQKYVFNNGQFSLFTDGNSSKITLENGSYSVSVAPKEGWKASNLQQVINITLPQDANKLFLFGQQPEQIQTQGKTTLVSDPSRCGFTVGYTLSYENTGTTVVNGFVELHTDPLFVIESVSPEPTDSTGTSLYWEFENLAPQQVEKVKLQVKMPDFEHMGDTLTSSFLSNYKAIDDSYTFADTTVLQQVLTCSYDPNDIQAIPAGVGAKHLTLKSQELQYLVRFQNMGNDYALNIKVTNELQQDFDLSTFKVLGSSHSMYTTQKDNLVSFHFDNIMLPDDKTNEPASHGYILYSIKPKSNLPDSTVLYNEANIYFDYNPAVLTNTAFNTLVTTLPATEKNALSIKQDRQHDFTIYPNPAKEYIRVQWHVSNGAEATYSLQNSLGQVVHTVKGSGGEDDFIRLPHLAKGVYLLRAIYGDSSVVRRVIIQ